MAYVVIFGVTYLLVGFLRFFAMSQKMASAADRLRQNGISQREIDELYRSMGAPTLVALIAFTAVTGTIVAIAVSVGYWLISD